LTCSGGPTAQIHGNATEITVQICGKMTIPAVVKLLSPKYSRSQTLLEVVSATIQDFAYGEGWQKEMRPHENIRCELGIYVVNGVNILYSGNKTGYYSMHSSSMKPWRNS